MGKNSPIRCTPLGILDDCDRILTIPLSPYRVLDGLVHIFHIGEILGICGVGIVADSGVGGLIAVVREAARHTQAKKAFVGLFLAEHNANGSTQDGK